LITFHIKHEFLYLGNLQATPGAVFPEQTLLVLVISLRQA